MYQAILENLEGDVSRQIGEHDTRRGPLWVPEDLLYDGEKNSEARREIRRTIRNEAEQLPPEVWAVFVLNLLTEEGLPTFNNLLTAGVADLETAWDTWLRKWTAEEDRHGVVLARYAQISEMFDLSEFERMQHEYLEKGFRPNWKDDEGRFNPLMMLAYVAAQERATQIAHGNVARLCGNAAPRLRRILGKVSGEEGHHATFYIDLFRHVVERFPEKALEAFWGAVSRFSMPGKSITYYRTLSLAAMRLDVFSGKDLGNIVAKLSGAWKIEDLKNLSSRAGNIRDRLLKLPSTLSRLHERAMNQPVSEYRVSFLKAPFTA